MYFGLSEKTFLGGGYHFTFCLNSPGKRLNTGNEEKVLKVSKYFETLIKKIILSNNLYTKIRPWIHKAHNNVKRLHRNFCAFFQKEKKED